MKALKDKKVDIAIDTKWPFIGPFLKFLEGFAISELLDILGVKQKYRIKMNC